MRPAKQSQVSDVVTAATFGVGSDMVDLKMSPLIAPHSFGTEKGALIAVVHFYLARNMRLDIARMALDLGWPCFSFSHIVS